MADEQMIILTALQDMAKSTNVDINPKYAEKIARAKKMMFGLEEWSRCPCDSVNPDRYCGSELCKQDIEDKGVCCCNCYVKKGIL